VKSLSVEQVRAIWKPASGVQTWKDVDPSWPDRRIVFYSPDNDSGTFEIFTEAIAGKARGQREGVQQSSDDNTLVMGVAGDADALGYFGFAYYAANRDKLRAVAIRGEASSSGVLPSLETIADRSYAPLSRPLFIYVKNSAARRTEVAAFLRFYLTNVDRISAKAGYAPPTSEDKASNQAALARLMPEDAGTPAPVARAE
ncbi:MAG: substrate-binding domain-containing protein, partial [Isosphaeraceae bacterium]